MISKKRLWTFRLLSVVVILTAAAAGWYTLYWMKTPEYAAGMIRESYETRNFPLFQHYVDLPVLYGALYDDAAEQIAPDRGSSNSLVVWAIKKMKDPAVEEMIRQTQEEFEKNPASADNDPWTEELLNRLKSRVGTAALTLSDIISIERAGQNAVLSVRVHDGDLNREFIWKIEMTQSSDGSWKAVKIINFRDYLNKRAQLEAQHSKKE